MCANNEAIRTVKKSADFTERFAITAIVSFVPDGSVFVIDFLRPVMDIVVDKEGRVKGVHGELELSVRIILPPIACKRLLNALRSAVEKYESMFGEIPIREQIPEQVKKEET